ncbi:MAG: SCO family protein [Alphaproteobacteria bacterium]|nr:SCO family protein [Alphaproteobacteria bacterium]
MLRRPHPWLAPLAAALLLSACWGRDAYILHGVVLEVRPDGEVIVDHEAVPGLMGAMVMPFGLSDSARDAGLKPGDRIVARLMVHPDGTVLDKVRVTGHQALPEPTPPEGPGPIRPGQSFPTTQIPVTGGETWTIGQGQPKPTLLTFLYTRCPIPAYCPLTVSRLQALQDQVGTDARLLAVTIDLAHDDLDTLQAFAASAGARPDTWRFGRVDGAAFDALALQAALPFTTGGGEIVHSLRTLVLDAQGTLVERYDDNAFPLDRVVTQLRTGGPAAPPDSDGTISRPPPE